MSTYVPNAVQEGLDAARISRLKSSSKLRIETQDGYFRMLRLWDTGFSVASEDAPHIRGFADIYDGPSQMFQCLIVASSEESGEMRYEFKRMTAVQHTPPSDFATSRPKPVAMIDDLR
ncbi:MAG: hypothetical protein ABJL99_13400 [Aliishimia sp.]